MRTTRYGSDMSDSPSQRIHSRKFNGKSGKGTKPALQSVIFYSLRSDPRSPTSPTPFPATSRPPSKHRHPPLTIRKISTDGTPRWHPHSDIPSRRACAKSSNMFDLMRHTFLDIISLHILLKLMCIDTVLNNTVS